MAGKKRGLGSLTGVLYFEHSLEREQEWNHVPRDLSVYGMVEKGALVLQD